MTKRERAKLIDQTLLKAAAGQVERAGAITTELIRRVHALSIERLDWSTALIAWSADQIDLIAKSLVAAHLGAFVDGHKEVQDHRADIRLATAQDSAIDAAIDFLSIDEQALAEIADRYGQWASLTWSSEVTQSTLAIEETIRLTIAESIQQGDHTAAGIERLAEALGDLGLTGAKPYRLETIYRTQTSLAYSAGAAQFDQAPAVDEILWGYEYDTVGDDRVRPNHAALEGLRAPKDDPIWRTHRTPNGWGCRCQLLRIFKDEDDLATPHRGPDADTLGGPDEGWDWNPLAIVNDLARAD